MWDTVLLRLGAILVMFGGLPQLVTYSHVAFPLWWNTFQFPLTLCGLIGIGLLGMRAKGKSDHSTQEQVDSATEKTKK